MKDIFAFCLAVALVAVFAAPAFIFEAFVLQTVWGWFAVPGFGWPPLSLPLAIGMAVFVGLLTNQYYATPDGKTLERIRFQFLHPAGVLVVAWIAKQWL